MHSHPVLAPTMKLTVVEQLVLPEVVNFPAVSAPTKVPSAHPPLVVNVGPVKTIAGTLVLLVRVIKPLLSMAIFAPCAAKLIAPGFPPEPMLRASALSTNVPRISALLAALRKNMAVLLGRFIAPLVAGLVPTFTDVAMFVPEAEVNLAASVPLAHTLPLVLVN